MYTSLTSPTAPSGIAFDWSAWQRPPAAYSHCPFWFWNDALDEAEIIRQIDDFRAHGVEAFVIHPRIGLPRSSSWLSNELFGFMRVALSHAQKHGMWVLLYDEGMYPSGSAGGLVVAENPDFQARGLVCQPADSTFAKTAEQANIAKPHANAPASTPAAHPYASTPGHTHSAEAATNIPANALRLRLANGRDVAIYDRQVKAVVRGLHYIDNPDKPDSPFEEEPTAADLLNPEAVACFIRLVYDRFYAELGEFFGNTVKGIFTDEPHPLSRLCEQGVMPGTLAALPHINRCLGYDFTPYLPALWFDNEPMAAQKRLDYQRAIAALMDAHYYRPLENWCERHGIALTGHPAEPDDIGHLRHLHIPGQDIVWRHIMPATASALEGAPSTMAKAAASVKFHLGRARNLNEFAGAYGDELTFRELRWLASWLLIRGCDMLVPHAFYYSLRGPRRHERPPNVGPGCAWWGADYTRWEAQTRRLCWLNATCQPVCEVAILGSPTRLPWQAAKACFENQIDFHYVEPADLQGAQIAGGCLRIGPGVYKVLIVEQGYEDQAADIPQGTPVLHWQGEHCVHDLLSSVAPAIALAAPAPGLRARLLKTTAGRTDILQSLTAEHTAHEPRTGNNGRDFILSVKDTISAENSASNCTQQDDNATTVLLLFNESEEDIRCQTKLNGLRLNLADGSVAEAINDSTCELEIAAHEWAVFLLSPAGSPL